MKFRQEIQLEEEQFYLIKNLNYVSYLDFVIQGKGRKSEISLRQYLELEVVILKTFIENFHQ